MLREKGTNDADVYRDFQSTKRWDKKAESDLSDSLFVDPPKRAAIIAVGMNDGSLLDQGGGRRLFGERAFRPSSHEREVMNQNPKTSIRRAANQALQTTSITRSVFGKVPVFDRHRRGV